MLDNALLGIDIICPSVLKFNSVKYWNEYFGLVCRKPYCLVMLELAVRFVIYLLLGRGGVINLFFGWYRFMHILFRTTGRRFFFAGGGGLLINYFLDDVDLCTYCSEGLHCCWSLCECHWNLTSSSYFLIPSSESFVCFSLQITTKGPARKDLILSALVWVALRHC